MFGVKFDVLLYDLTSTYFERGFGVASDLSSEPESDRGPYFHFVFGVLLASQLKARLKRCANGLTPRVVLEKFAMVQMLDVYLPTTDNREIVLTRYTQPEKELLLLLDQLKMTLPEQPPPKIYSH